jgi:hypothetical protein
MAVGAAPGLNQNLFYSVSLKTANYCKKQIQNSVMIAANSPVNV